MTFVGAVVTRYLDDDPLPGIVECLLVDAAGRSHRFVEKTAVVSERPLRPTSSYPIAIRLACEIEARWQDHDGTPLVRISTEQPWGMQSTTGQTRFVVASSQLSDAPADGGGDA